MLSMIRIGASRVGGQLVGLHKVPNNAIFQQVAFISHKDLRQDLPPRPKPFPYWEKNYNLFYRLFDSTLKRFDDNSKVICVEGPIASGKDTFCRQFAEAFDMKYFPPMTFDYLYTNYYGMDMRNFDDQLPVNLHTHDLPKFLKDPHHINTAIFQFNCYKLKFDRYTDALLHLLSTGQGVVVQRCPWSDFVFVQAMVNAGYMSENAQSMYNDTTIRTLHRILKPHVIFYLDVDPQITLKNIKKRAIPMEINSKVLTEKYITDIENNYKQKFLKELEPFCHIMSYDWSEGGDIDFLYEDVEALKFVYTQRDDKMEEWNVDDEELWSNRRWMFSPENRDQLLGRLTIPRFDVKEMHFSGAEQEVYHMFETTTPGYRYEEGFDPELDGNLWFKMNSIPKYKIRQKISEHCKQGKDNLSIKNT